VYFHLLTDGSCLARLADGSEEVEVTAGDLLLFPHDHRHILGTDLTLSPAPVGSEPLDAPPVPHVVIGCALWQMS
jgi:Cupin